MTQQAQQTVSYGENLRQTNENKRQMNLLGLKAGRQDAVRDYQSARSAQNSAIMGGIGDIVGAGVSGFASGGGFSKGGFKMDTFLGRDKNFGDVTKILGDGSAMVTGEGGPVGNFESADAVYSSGGTGYDSQEVINERLKKEQEKLYKY